MVDVVIGVVLVFSLAHGRTGISTTEGTHVTCGCDTPSVAVVSVSSFG